MAARPFDALFIDFYGTISAGDREAVQAACERIVAALGLPVTAHELTLLWGNCFFRTAEASNHESFRTLYECELISLRDTLRPFVGEVDPVPYVAELEDYWQNPDVYADALDLLDAIDLPVCCVSNTDDKHIYSAMQRHRLSFDAVITSEAVRCYKPEAAIFQRAVETLGVDPRRTLHVGDSLHSDIGGAQKLGITTVWLRRESRVHDIGQAAADHTIGSLRELPALLGLNGARQT